VLSGSAWGSRSYGRGELSAGPGVERLEVGDEVFGVTSIHEAGAFAEYVVADEKNVGLKPPSISFEPTAALTPGERDGLERAGGESKG
jgi:NADPH:quinone reductase-like Zn-dependent oxidoreductase